MKVFKTIFWNTEEARFRAGYRIFIQTAAYFVIMEILYSFLGSPREMTGQTSLWIFLALAGARLLRGLASVWFTGRFLDHRSFSAFGLNLDKEWFKDFVFGLGLGILLIGGIFIFELAAGWVSIRGTLQTANAGGPFSLAIIIFAVLFIGVGFSEELFYRGYLLTNLAEGFAFKSISLKTSIILTVIFSSALFGLFHIGSPNASLVSTLNIILAGVLFSVPFILTGSLAIPVGMHITWNFFQGNIFGFPVSGLTLPREAVSLFSVSQSGPELWTGGQFGPEAGLLSLFAFSAGIVIIYGWVRYRKGNVKLHTLLAQPPVKLQRQAAE